MTSQKEISFRINNEVLSTCGVSFEEISEALSIVYGLVGKHDPSLVPLDIQDAVTLHRVLHLCDTLYPLAGQANFKEFLGSLQGEHFESNFFTAQIARALLPHSQKVIFEPSIPGSPKRPDLLVVSQGVGIFFECKMLSVNVSQFEAEHRRVWEIIGKSLDTPHQVTITFQTPLSETALQSLRDSIQARLSHLTNTGTIIHNDTVKVHVQTRTDAPQGRPGISFRLSMVVHHLDAIAAYPAHLFQEGKFGLVVEGPAIDTKKWLKEAIRRAAGQATSSHPYVLVLDASRILGEYRQIQRMIFTEFQPTQNTRFSGVLLFRPPHAHQHQIFELVRNPFARNPLPEGFEFWINRIPAPAVRGPFGRLS
jgi:hypothetical protein